MIGPLLRAELSARRPLLPLAAAAGLAAPWLPWALGAAPPLASAGPLLLAGGPREQALQGAVILGLGWVATAQAFRRQEEPGVDDFLARLPLDPRLAFAARLGSAAAVLLLALLLRQLLQLSCALLWGDGLPGSAAPLGFLGEAVEAAVGLGVGALLCRAGAAGWAALALLVAGAEALAGQRDLPALQLLRLADPGQGAPWLGLLGWSLLAAVTALAAGARFLRRVPAPASPAAAAVRGRATARLSPAVALLASAALVLLPRESPAEEPRVTFPRARVTTRTARWQFSGLSPLPRAARELLERADELHARVAALLGIEPRSERLQVVLQQEGGGGAALPPGAVGLELGRPGGPALHLAAATAELLLDRAAGRARAGLLRPGLVRHVAWRAAEVDPFWSRFHAAVLHARRPLQLDELFDPHRLARTRGADAAPALGELLVAALVRLRGDAALHAIAREPEPIGQAAWEALLGSVGVTPEALLLAMVELAEDGAPADPRAWIPLPRLHALEDPQDQPGLRLVAVPDRAVPTGWEVLCRVLARNETLPRPAVGLGKEPQGSWAFTVDVPVWAEEAPRVQLGLRPAGDAAFRETIWEEWAAPP